MSPANDRLLSQLTIRLRHASTSQVLGSGVLYPVKDKVPSPPSICGVVFFPHPLCRWLVLFSLMVVGDHQFDEPISISSAQTCEAP